MLTRSYYLFKQVPSDNDHAYGETVSIVYLLGTELAKRGNAFALMCENVSYLTSPGHPVLRDPVIRLNSPLEESTVVCGSLGIFLSPHSGIEVIVPEWKATPPLEGERLPFSLEVLDDLLREDHIGFLIGPTGPDSWSRISRNVANGGQRGLHSGTDLIDVLLLDVQIFAKPDDDGDTFRIYGRDDADLSWLEELCLRYGMEPMND